MGWNLGQNSPASLRHLQPFMGMILQKNHLVGTVFSSAQCVSEPSFTGENGVEVYEFSGQSSDAWKSPRSWDSLNLNFADQIWMFVAWLNIKVPFQDGKLTSISEPWRKKTQLHPGILWQKHHSWYEIMPKSHEVTIFPDQLAFFLGVPSDKLT